MLVDLLMAVIAAHCAGSAANIVSADTAGVAIIRMSNCDTCAALSVIDSDDATAIVGSHDIYVECADTGDIIATRVISQ